MLCDVRGRVWGRLPATLVAPPVAPHRGVPALRSSWASCESNSLPSSVAPMTCRRDASGAASGGVGGAGLAAAAAAARSRRRGGAAASYVSLHRRSPCAAPVPTCPKGAKLSGVMSTACSCCTRAGSCAAGGCWSAAAAATRPGMALPPLARCPMAGCACLLLANAARGPGGAPRSRARAAWVGGWVAATAACRIMPGLLWVCDRAGIGGFRPGRQRSAHRTGGEQIGRSSVRQAPAARPLQHEPGIRLLRAPTGSGEAVSAADPVAAHLRSAQSAPTGGGRHP